MTVLLVIDETLKNVLVAQGNRILSEQKDVNGKYAWTIGVDNLTFNINDNAFIGKFSVSDTLKLNF